MKITCQKIGYAIEFLGTIEKSLQAAVDSGEITAEEMKAELKNQAARHKTKRVQPKESEMTPEQRKQFIEQKKKLAAPLHSIEDHQFIKEIYFERVPQEYLREVLHGKPALT